MIRAVIISKDFISNGVAFGADHFYQLDSYFSPGIDMALIAMKWRGDMSATRVSDFRLFKACGALLVVGVMLFAWNVAAAETVGIIGTGRVGGALGPQLARHGYKVVYGSREPAAKKVQDLVARTGPGAVATSQRAAAAQADFVLLAVPWSATEQVLKGLGDLSGKVILDAVNPLQRADDGLLEIAVSTSGALHVQSWAPGAAVVKAFNTVNYLVMADPATAGGPVTVPLAGDDPVAKQRVRELVEKLGFETADVGPLRMSRELEGMVVLHLVPILQKRPEDLWEYYFRVHPK
jgi:predicted dinucleotide-binding enzyme